MITAQEARPRSPGRPRNEQSRVAVLRATSQLLAEVGLWAMTTEEISNRWRSRPIRMRVPHTRISGG